MKYKETIKLKALKIDLSSLSEQEKQVLKNILDKKKKDHIMSKEIEKIIEEAINNFNKLN